MDILKALHPSLLHRTYDYLGCSHFAVSLLWGFRLDSGEAVLEIHFWPVIAKVLGKGAIFDAAMPKAQGEVLVHGSFFAPGSRPALRGRLSVRLGNISKELMVYGDRRWAKSLGITTGIEGPEPFREMPITYENAFGGEGYDRNPIGKGHVPLEDEEGSYRPLPNIEYPDKPIASPGDRPPPAGLGRIDTQWQPSLSRAGTYDRKYIKSRMPGLPDDIDWLFFNDAPEDQWNGRFFRGNEEFEITHMHPEGEVIQGRLPGVRGRCFVNQDVKGEIRFVEIPTVVDTAHLFPGENLGVLIHRGTLEVKEDDGSDIKQILLAHEWLDDPPRPEEHYSQEMIKRTDPDTATFAMADTAALIPRDVRCGLKSLVEEFSKDRGDLQRANLNAFVDRKVAEAKGQIEEIKGKAADQLRQAGLDASVLDSIDPSQGGSSPEGDEIKRLLEEALPSSPDGPGGIDISRVSFKKLEKVYEYVQELAKKAQAQAMDGLKDQLERLKSQKVPGPEVSRAIVQLEGIVSGKMPPAPLPRIDVEGTLGQMGQMIEQSQKQAMVSLSMGVQPEQIAGLMSLDIDDIEAKVRESLGKAKDSYIMGAHYIAEATSPHEGKEPEIAAALLQAYKKGGMTAEGDYAYLDLSGQDLTGIDLSGSYLEHANLAGTNLTNANLSRAILAYANLTGTNLTGANLTGANLGATNMENTLLADADLTGAILGRAQIKKAKFHRCQLVGRMEMFLETKMEQADFTGSNLQKNNFIEADISGCCFCEADLSESNFIKPIAHGAIFDKAILQGVNFVQMEAKRASFQGARARNMRFVGGCNLAGANFQGAQAPEANLRDCNLKNADLTEAMLHKADLGGSDLTGARLVRADAVQAQFNKAILLGADLERIDLREGSLYKARLAGASLVEANLYAVNFMGCITEEPELEGADFTDAYLERVNLRKKEAEVE